MQEEEDRLKMYRRRLKIVSIFFIIFASLIMVNACIGASSAPFYDTETECSTYDTTPECTTLKKYASALYGFEVIGSLILVFHGLLGTVLIDYMKKIWLIRCLNYYTKIALILYVADVILRTAIYFKIITIVDDVELEGED
jgi:hypothetical protein